MKNLYLLSGLGADERVYQNIDFGNNNVKHISWLKPYTNETIDSYAYRLTEQIESEDPVLIGVSFGGILAIEISKKINTNSIIIISSVKTSLEVPLTYKLSGLLNFNALIPKKILNRPSPILNYMFGAKTKPEKETLHKIIKESDPDFLKWGIGKILKWRNTEVPNNLIHIHGTKDKVLPYRNVKNVIPIESGGHLMLLNKSEILTKIINQHL